MASGTSELERLIDEHATRAGFIKQNDRDLERRTYYRPEPPASVMFRMQTPEHAMLRSPDEFYKWLERSFDK